jgi:hypothetical protein
VPKHFGAQAQRAAPTILVLKLKLLVILFVLVSTAVSSWAIPLDSLIPKKDLPEGWTLFHGPQTFTRKTLFKHINGQAELFFKYGFEKSVFAIYQNEKSHEDQIEVDVYDMGNVVQAFGIFSRFRNEDRPGGFGLDSYLDDHSAFFYKGKCFVMLYAAESNPDLLRQFSTLISAKISDFSPPPKEIGYFPKDGLKAGSIQYFPEGLLGRKFLKRGFQGTYVGKVEDKDKVEVMDKVKGKEFHLFLAIFKDSQEAMNALKVYENDLSKKGKISSESIIQFGPRALKGEDPYQGRIIAIQKRFYLLGAVGFEKEEEAENRLAELMKNLK